MNKPSRFKKTIAYYLVLAACFYVLPLGFMVDTGSAMFILLGAISLVVFACSFIYSLLLGFSWFFLVILVLIWVPVGFYIMGSAAGIYGLIYFGLAFVAHMLGSALYKLRKKPQDH